MIRAVTNIDDAYLLLKEKVLPVFEFENIALNFDIINDHFFKKILVTCVFNILRELIDRTRIYLHPSAGRNMFGIVDEYGVLEYGQVFFQYTMRHEKKLSDYEDRQNYSMEQDVLQKYVGPVVITKNPCHHPGDLRVFQAVYHEKLAHLKDCIVFPQKGPRPHPNEISGSDLDGLFESCLLINMTCVTIFQATNTLLSGTKILFQQHRMKMHMTMILKVIHRKSIIL